MQEACWREFDLAVCRWIVKEIPPDELPDAAAAALTAECETQALIRLAGMDHATWSEFPPVVAKIFEERGRAMPTFGEAVKTLADDLLHQIVDGSLAARAGTHELYRLARNLWEHPAFKDLSVFIGFDDSFDMADRGIYNTPEQVEAAVLATARDLVARGGVRSV